MSEKYKGVCINRYKHEGKDCIEVVVQKRDKQGKTRKKKSRFTKSGNRITSLRAAEAVKASLRRELEREIDSISTYTWQQWKEAAVEEMRANGLKESTLKNYEGILDNWRDGSWADKELSLITRSDIYEYIHDFLVHRGATDWTRKNIHKRIHKIFEMAVEAGEIIRNPSKGIRVDVKREEGVALTPSEVEILLTKGKEINHEYYPHWVVALLTGMRSGELFALRWRNIDFEVGIIHVNIQFTSKDGVHPPKKGKIRPIDLGPELREFLLHLKKTIPPVKQRLWSWKEEMKQVDEVRNGRPTGKQVLKRVKTRDYFDWDDLVLPRIRSWQMGMQAQELRAFCKQIGIREIKFHDLRATHITNLLSNGVSISKVMRQVGHSQMSTTDAYHRLTGVEVKGITENLGFGVPSTEIPDNVVSLFPRKASQ